MTFEGAQFQGQGPIMEKLASLVRVYLFSIYFKTFIITLIKPFKQVQHQVTTMDAQPVIGVDDNKVYLKKQIE